MLEENVDEKYYLSDKTIHYILDADNVALNSGRNINNRVVNSNIAKTISCRSVETNQRADVSNFVIDGANDEITVRNLKEQLCDELIRDGKVKENDMIRHSYTNWRKENFHTENSRNNNISATLTTRPDTLGIVVKKDTENYIEWEEKGKLDIDCRVYKDDKITGAIVTSNKNKVLTIGNYSPSNHNASRIVDKDGIAPTVMENHGTVTATNISNLRIRKLIPLETWLLMGFDREDFMKAEQVNSNAQLYKQAGNSIVVNVLEAILGNLLDKKEEE